MPKAAIGLPDPESYGDPSKLKIKKLIDYVLQKHDAERAKLHYDLRIGDKDTGLLSWAVRKGLPLPGQKHLAISQPLHSHSYKDFQGVIPEGYGKGTVSTEDKGEVLVTKASPNAISFTLAHKSIPERYVLTRTGYGKDGKGWLLLNVTPTKPPTEEKKRYVPVSAERAEKIIDELQPGMSVSPKVDGAANLYKLLKDKIEVVSFRTSKKTGGPIVHTERAGLYPTDYNTPLPKELEGTTVRGELYGTDKDNRPIPPQELGGLLNSSVAKSLRSQEAKGIKLKSLLYDIDTIGNRRIDGTSSPYLDRYKLLQDIEKYLPKEKMQLAPQERTTEGARRLWEEIKHHKHPLSQEGVVINRPMDNPIKAKLVNDYDVVISSMFPAKGKYKDKAVGGFNYSLKADGPVVGRVGTGFSDELRADMYQRPDDYLGRTAKILSQGQYPATGAYRAPALWSLHEDPRGN